MCVGVSAKVVRVDKGTALVDALGAEREVTAELLEELEPGDYVMVHAGMAIAKVMQSGEEEAGALLADLLDGTGPAKELR
ncbi:MAG: HypC/HybG/HupF family hydrogenase formation chaperone [Mailhella sp.]|nr:HypC/HybG/HupF family hydrogenase formation chaperone [Mailhella sp.]